MLSPWLSFPKCCWTCLPCPCSLPPGTQHGQSIVAPLVRDEKGEVQGVSSWAEVPAKEMSLSGRGRLGFFLPKELGAANHPLSGRQHQGLQRALSPSPHSSSSSHEVSEWELLACVLFLVFTSSVNTVAFTLIFCSDRLVPELDTIVPMESTKAYDMLDIIHAVSLPVC